MRTPSESQKLQDSECFCSNFAKCVVFLNSFAHFIKTTPGGRSMLSRCPSEGANPAQLFQRTICQHLLALKMGFLNTLHTARTPPLRTVLHMVAAPGNIQGRSLQSSQVGSTKPPSGGVWVSELCFSRITEF